MSINRFLLQVFLCLIFCSTKGFSIDFYLGPALIGGITRGYGDVGSYHFSTTYRSTNSPITTVRSLNQMVQFTGGVGLDLDININSFYSLSSECFYLFHQGLSYWGNYNSDTVYPHGVHTELTGKLRYHWQAIHWNLLHHIRLVEIHSALRLYATLGSSIYYRIGEIRQHLQGDLLTGNRPSDEDLLDTRDTKAKSLDIGIIAGIGMSYHFSDESRLDFAIRSNWYFIPYFSPYPNKGREIKMSIPINLVLSYLFKLW